MAAVTHDIVVNAPVSEVFEFWKNFENFPRFMHNIESIQVVGPELTHWKMKGPLGVPIEWDAKTTALIENQKISWESTSGVIENHGSVVFEELDGNSTPRHGRPGIQGARRPVGGRRPSPNSPTIHRRNSKPTCCASNRSCKKATPA